MLIFVKLRVRFKLFVVYQLKRNQMYYVIYSAPNPSAIPWLMYKVLYGAVSLPRSIMVSKWRIFISFITFVRFNEIQESIIYFFGKLDFEIRGKSSDCLSLVIPKCLCWICAISCQNLKLFRITCLALHAATRTREPREHNHDYKEGHIHCHVQV